MLRRLTILLLLLLPLFGHIEVAAESLYVVTANSLNVRSGPGTQYSVQRKLHRGDTVVVLSKKGQWATVQIPYKEEIDFIQHPDTKILIQSLKVDKDFQLSKEIVEATEDVLAEFNKEKKCTDDPHPRLSSLTKIADDKWECTIEKATYFQQIRTNLTLDFRINIEGKRGMTMRGYEYSISEKLADFSKSKLSNAIGVSAIWIMGKPGHEQVFLLPRKKKVGVFESRMGTASGNVEMPKNSCFSDSSLIEFLKWDMAREFAEETGLCGKNIDMNQFSQLVDCMPTMIEYVNITPLAFVRELLRGGKPQMFFVIETPEVPLWKLKRSFRRSLGKLEFDDPLFTDRIPSSETMCNYIYFLKWYQQGQSVDKDKINLDNFQRLN